MIEAPHEIVPQLTKGLSQLNSEGEIVVDRAALAMLAAVDGVTSVAELARIHGADRTRDGLAELSRIGAVYLDIRRSSSSLDELDAPDDPADFEAEDGAMELAWYRRTDLWSSPWVIGALTAAGFAWVVVSVALMLSITRQESVLESRDAGAIIEDAGINRTDDDVRRRPNDGRSMACDAGMPCREAAGTLPSRAEPKAAVSVGANTTAQDETSVAAISQSEERATSQTNSGSVLTALPPEDRDGAASASAAGAPPAEIASGSPTDAAGPASSTPVRSAPSIVLDEHFSDNRGGWPNDPSSTAWLAEGGYRMFARTPGKFVAVGVPGAGRLRNVTLTGTFRKVGGPPGGGYGFVVRDQADSGRDGIEQRGQFYVLEAGDRGEIGVWRRDGDIWTDLVSWQPSQIVKAGDAPNELTVKIDGEHLTFVVNGVQVARVTDSTLTEGAVGLFVGGDGNDVLLHSLHIESAE